MSEKLAFENVLIDTDAFELRIDGEETAVEPLVLDLIIEMARHPGTLRTREDLIETVWKGRIVSDTTIATAIKSARKALGDTQAEKRIIRTVRGRGFQFSAMIVRDTGPCQDLQAPGSELPLLHIEVTALDETVSPASTRFLDGRLRTIFNRIPFMNIAAGAGTATNGDATHLLEVALSSIGESIHADVTLSDTRSGIQRWARHFLGSAPVCEKLATDIGSRAEPEILNEMSGFLVARNDSDPRALVLQAMQVIAVRGWNPTSITAANALLERAITKDESIALAHALLSLLNALGYRVGMLRKDERAVARAIESAEKALALETQSSTVLGLTGCALCDVGQLHRGEPIINHALDLDPMNGHAHAAKGAALMLRGEFEAALAPLRKSIEISPADSRLAVWGAILAMAELRCGQLEQACSSVAQAMSRDDVNYLPRLTAVVIHLAREDMSAFEAALKELLRVHPGITSDEILYFVGTKAKDCIWPAIEAQRC